ncbi:hypothetical protein HYU07_06960 [Candidatus Woesearchaeota archaeon]|nr:hypothetical protein [Candidatus Woesearchaeota archaeon]
MNNLELRRQILHLIFGLAVVYLIYIGVLTDMAIFLLIIVGFLLSLISKYIRLPLVGWFLDRFEREENIKAFPGSGMLFFMIGALLSLKLFNENIALASIMILTVGDSISHIIGAEFGVIQNPFSNNGKKLEGTLVGILVGFVAALVFVRPLEALLASVGAMIAEVIELEFNKRPVDDNIVVPLAAGTIILLVRKYL